MALLDVILGYDCNLWCDYCTITPEMRRRDLPAAKVAEAIARARVLGYDRISFTGGEPTLRRDLIPLVKHARDKGFGDIKVQSNGLMLAHRPNLERLLQAGVNRLHVSIHTHRAEQYDTLVRREGSYPLMVQALENAVAAGVELVADVILKEDTYRAFPEAVRWLHEKGVRNVDVWFVSLTDGNRENVASMPKMSEAVPFVREALAFAREHGMTVRSLHVPRCLLGSDHVHAWDPGAGRVMVVTPDATFELSDSRLAGRVHVAACDGCEHRAICPGIRPDYIERYGSEEFGAVGASPAPVTVARSTS